MYTYSEIGAINNMITRIRHMLQCHSMKENVCVSIWFIKGLWIHDFFSPSN